MPSEILGASAISLDPDGAVEWEKNADTDELAYSTSKVLSMYLGRQYISDAMLDDTTTVDANAGGAGGSTAQLDEGDVISFRDLFYGAMLPSGNDAARAIAGWYVTSVYGYIPSTGYKTLAGEFARTQLGWTATNSQMGASDNGLLASAREMAGLGYHLMQNDPWLFGVMGTLTRTLTVSGGPNPRSINVAHTIDPVARDLPEFAGGKTGSGTGSPAPGALLLFWEDPDAGVHTTMIMASTTSGRYSDVRTIIDDIVGPVVVPPPAGGRFVSRGGVLLPAVGYLSRSGTLVPLV